MVTLLHQAGAAAVIVHGRTMEQRYSSHQRLGLGLVWACATHTVQGSESSTATSHATVLTSDNGGGMPVLAYVCPASVRQQLSHVRGTMVGLHGTQQS